MPPPTTTWATDCQVSCYSRVVVFAVVAVVHDETGHPSAATRIHQSTAFGLGCCAYKCCRHIRQDKRVLLLSHNDVFLLLCQSAVVIHTHCHTLTFWVRGYKADGLPGRWLHILLLPFTCRLTSPLSLSLPHSLSQQPSLWLAID